MAELTTETRFGGTCPSCGKWLTYRPLPGGQGHAYPPRLPFMGVTCRHCGAKATLDADAGQDMRQPLVIDRDQLDLSELNAHIREHHHDGKSNIRGRSAPYSLAQRAGWHASQHHRSHHSHHHFGPFALVRRPGERHRPVGQIVRPLGWWTGQDVKTDQQLKDEWRAKHPLPGKGE